MPNVEADASLQLTMNAKDNAGTVVDHVTGILQTFRGAVGAAGLAAASAFLSSVEPTAQYAAVLERIHALTNLSTEDSSKLLAGFTASGYGADQSAAMIQRLSMRLGTLIDSAAGATDKGNAATTMFDRLGISAKDAHGNALPMSVLLPEIIDALNRIQDPLERARVESQLFGRNFAELAPLLANGGQAFKDAMNDAQRFGTIMGQQDVDNVRKFRDEQARLNEALLGLQIMLGTYVIPYLTQAIIWFENIAAAVHQFIAPIKDLILPGLALVALFGSLIGGASAIASVLTLVAGSMGPIGALIVGITTPFLGLIGVLGLVVAGFLLLKAVYDRSAEAHRILAPLVQELVGFLERARDAATFFLNAIAQIGPVDALGGSMRILGFNLKDTITVTDTLRGALAQVMLVVNTVKDAVEAAIKTWQLTHDPVQALATALSVLGVNSSSVLSIIGAVRNIFDTLGQDWQDFSKAIMPALAVGLQNLSASFGSVVTIVQTLAPIALTIAQFLGTVLLAAIQLLIRVGIVVLPPAIELITAAIRVLTGALAGIITWLTQNGWAMAGLATIVGGILLPTLIALGIQFTVNLVRGLIAAVVQVGATTVAFAAQGVQMIINNVQLAAYLVGLTATTIASGAVRIATLAWSAAQWLLNVALDANPIGLVIIAIALLVAGIIWAYNNVGFFHDAVNLVWAVLQGWAAWIGSTLVPAIGSFFSWLGSTASNAINAVGNAFSGLGTTVHNIWTGISSLIRAQINVIIGAIDSFIRGINNITIPSWVPDVGGMHSNIPQIAYLAQGALVGPSYGGARIAMVGEGREDEVVAKISQIMQAARSAPSASDGAINISLILDGNVLAKAVLKRGGDKWKLQAGTLGSGA